MKTNLAIAFLLLMVATGCQMNQAAASATYIAAEVATTAIIQPTTMHFRPPFSK